MKFKKLIPATIISLAIPTAGLSCIPVMAEPAETSAEQIVDVNTGDDATKTGDGTASADSRTQTCPPSSSENSIKTQSDTTGTDEKFTGEKKENGVTYYYENDKKFTGERTVKDAVYYYKDGVKYTGNRKVDDVTYYYKDGVKYTGDQAENKVKYYYTDGIKTDKYITIEGTSVKVPLEGNKWVNLKGYWHFIKDGTLIKGWRNLTKEDGESVTHYSYFDKTNGRLYTGWKKMGKAEGESITHYSYFGDNGWLRTGWQYVGTKTNPDGKNKAHWSYFGKNGWLQTGWKYFTSADGEKTAHWSYFGDNGWLRTGWQSMGKGTSNSYSENNNKHMSYFGSNGWLQTGWKYFTSADGEKKNHWSYFGGNGWLATSTTKINGITCYFSGAGWLNKYETVTPHYQQNAYKYYTGCAGTCLFMALQYKGHLKDWTLPKFMGTMPYTNDGNPNNGFVGNPKTFLLSDNNRGIYPKALATWGSRYGDVKDISGSSTGTISDYVRTGNPVLVLATWNLVDYPVTWYSWGGYRKANHHFFLIVGYDYNTDMYKVMDPLVTTGNGSKWLNGAQFRKVYNVIKGAVVVKG